MLGLIVLAHELEGSLAPSALMEDLLGVPLLARAIAGALPADESVTAVVVTNDELASRARPDVVERFGFDEVDNIVTAGPGLESGLKAGLDALPDDVEHVVVTMGGQVLAPLGMVDRVIEAARAQNAAAPACPVVGHVVADEGDGVVPLDIRPRLRLAPRTSGLPRWLAPSLPRRRRRPLSAGCGRTGDGGRKPARDRRRR